MSQLTATDLMNLFRFFDNLKEPTLREKAAAERDRKTRGETNRAKRLWGVL